MLKFRVLPIFSVVFFCIGGDVFADDIQKYFEQGQQAYEQGNYQKAATLYEKVVEADPNYAPAYNALGLTYKGLNASLEDVTWLFKVAVEIDPSYVEAYDNQCKTYYQAQLFNEAETNCLKILSLVPSHGGAQFTLGWIYLGKKEPASAVRYFEEVLKRIQVPAVYLGLGMAYLQSGKRAEALDTITQLRSAGQLQMADQLEKMARSSSQPSAPSAAPSFVDVPEPRAGTIVSSGAQPSPSSESSAPQAGSMRVRLRGRLNTPPVSAPTQSAATTPSPQSSSGASRSAIERIRELQRRRLGVIPQPSGY